MDYAQSQALYFVPRQASAPPPGTTTWRTPARRLRDAVERIAMLDVWSVQAAEAFAAVGLDVQQGYVAGRASALGLCDVAVVASAFGVFAPGVLDGPLLRARQIAQLPAIRAARLAGAQRAVRCVVPDTSSCDRVAEVLRRGCAAAPTLGRPLFAGLSALPWPDEAPGRLWHAATMLRELRGDTHLAVCVAAGLTGIEMNLLTERWVGWPFGEYAATRGWTGAQIDAARRGLQHRGLLAGVDLTAAGRELRTELERRTDQGVAAVVSTIGSDLDDVVRQCTAWSEAITDAGMFPPDPYKVAAG